MSVYDLAYLAAVPVVAPVMAYKRMRYGKYRESIPGMLGRRLPSPLGPPEVHRCWLHSVSVGETIAAATVLRELKRLEPKWEFLCTTTTETGQAQARQVMKDADYFSFVPADASWIVRRFYATYQPSVYLFFETEIWPNILLEGGRRNTPIYLVNGSISERSSRRYAAFHSLFDKPLSHVRRFFMQTQEDAERIARVLRSDTRVEVTGNVKFDALPEPLAPEERAAIRAQWGADDSTIVVIAGSTHPTEEELIYRAFAEANAKKAEMLLVIAPRHPERFDQVAELFARQGLRVHRTSAGPNPARAAETDVVVLDQMRVLARMYGAAEIALVAGSWCAVGGHNLLEAAAHGVPVLRGPNMHEQPEIVRVLGPEDGAPSVEAAQLGEMIAHLAMNPDERRRMGALASAAANSNRGSAKRVVEKVLAELPKPLPTSRS